MLRITDQYFWNFIFTLFFLGLVAMGSIILESEARLAYTDLTLVDYLIITFATFRLTRLVVNDVITKWFREQFWDAKDSRGKVYLEKPERGPRRTIADLLSCPWCFGVWAAASVVFFYLLSPYAQLPILILAIAGAATWLHQLAQLTGYKAEQAKHFVE